MKRILYVALSMLMMFSAISCQGPSAEPVTTTAGQTAVATTPATTQAPKEYNYQTLKVSEHLDDVFRTLGRTYVKEDRLYLDFSNTGIHFVADCKDVVSVQIFVNPARVVAANYFSIYIDGELSSTRLYVDKTLSGQSFVIARGLEPGVHEFRLVNQTQFIWTQASLGEITIQGEFCEKPAERELFLEFYGDSISNGANVYMGETSVHTTDSTKSYAWLTAEALNADMSGVGCSAIGLTCNNRNFIMKDILHHCGAQYSSGADKNGVLLMEDIPLYDFARIPDAVIIALGTNDGGNAEKTVFKTELTNLVNHLREKYGKDVPIVYLTGYSSGAYNSVVPTLLNGLGGEDANLYVCKLSYASVAKADGGDGTHPNVATSEVMAAELTAFLKDLLNK
ncbi:MAG: hypothetical protein IJX28_06985 [Clostridia bacterium]|nr:hypothetical protein [Clostridia bacterium]